MARACTHTRLQGNKVARCLQQQHTADKECATQEAEAAAEAEMQSQMAAAAAARQAAQVRIYKHYNSEFFFFVLNVFHEKSFR